jgi:hypothetical protein
LAGEHDGGGGPAGGDQDVGVGERGGNVAGPQGASLHLCGYLGRSLLVAAGH